MAAKRFRWLSPCPTLSRGEQANSGYFYRTNLLLTNSYMHLLLPTSLFYLLEAPFAERQGLFLLFFRSIWLVAVIKKQNKTQS